MRLFPWIFLTLALLFISGCFQVDTLVTVNPDGSGTVVESMMLSKGMLAQMNAMMEGFSGEGGKKPKPIDLFEPDKLKAQAAGMGEGVTYMSGERCETANYSGYRATYAFKDINKLTLGQKEGEAAGEGGMNKPSMPIRFRFAKGHPATLTIEQPRDQRKEKSAETREKEPEAKESTTAKGGNGAMSDEEAKQLLDMFLGMKMGLAVEVNGPIVETNATHLNGRRITIIDFDLAKFGSSLPQLEKLKRLQESSPAEAMELMKAFPGMKVDLNEKVRVVFGK